MAKVLEQSTFRRYAAKVLSQLLFLLLSMYQFHIKHTCSADSVAVAVIDAKSFSAEFEFSSTFVVLAEYRVRKRCSQLIVRVVKQRSCTKQQQSSSSQKLICICIMYALCYYLLCVIIIIIIMLIIVILNLEGLYRKPGVLERIMRI